jgi:ABC-2 type transport system ATP-binding protein
MRIVADRIAVGSGPTAELPPLSLEFGTEEPAVVAVGAGQRPTVLSLVLTGRMRPTAGQVLLDGKDDPAALRRSLALVDTPTVADPHEDLALATVVREELALAHQRAGSGTVRRVLRDLGASEWAEAPVRLVPGAVRLRLLAVLTITTAATHAALVEGI